MVLCSLKVERNGVGGIKKRGMMIQKWKGKRQPVSALERPIIQQTSKSSKKFVC